jgi:prevent-host-death family protein
MPRVKLDTDIQPVSEFRAKAAHLIERVRRSRRPLVLTQRGRSAAVVIAVDEYEQLLEEVETLRDVRKSEDQINRGQAVSNQQAKIKLRRRFGG